MRTNDVMIDVTDVTHHYGVKPVLRNVSLRVTRGEVVVLMGPNGMGKSTLVGVVAGVLWPVEGTVTIDGLRRRSDEETELAIRRKVAYLAAEPWIPLLRTGREWLLAVGRLYGVPDDRLMDHVERLLDEFNLKRQAESNISGYSTGQRKKIALCCALATESPVLLLDEPFAGGLDPSGISRAQAYPSIPCPARRSHRSYGHPRPRTGRGSRRPCGGYCRWPHHRG